MVSPWHVKQAVRVLHHGGVIAYPTEAVWGLGCDPWNQQAVKRLLAFKQRPVSKGLILVAASLDQLGPLNKSLTDSERSLISTDTGTPTTWVIPDEFDSIPFWIKGLNKDVAIRVSTHPTVRALCHAYGGMIVSTSANRSGENAATTRNQLHASLGRELDYILPGQLGGFSRPSEIKVLRSGKVLRP